MPAHARKEGGNSKNFYLSGGRYYWGGENIKREYAGLLKIHARCLVVDSNYSTFVHTLHMYLTLTCTHSTNKNITN